VRGRRLIAQAGARRLHWRLPVGSTPRPGRSPWRTAPMRPGPLPRPPAARQP